VALYLPTGAPSGKTIPWKTIEALTPYEGPQSPNPQLARFVTLEDSPHPT